MMLSDIAIAATLLASAACGTPLPGQAISPGALIDQAISALGGEQALSALKGVTYRASR